MHLSLFISTWFAAQAHLPSTGTLLISIPILGFLLFAGSRAAFKTNSGRPADRVLTGQTDDKGVPVYFDVNSKNCTAFTAAREVSRTNFTRR
jgi:hypothetical protein